MLPTGQPGWGIGWYIEGLLVPELTLTRGESYTFRVFGGNDESDRSSYHPFYITDSRSGGRLLNTPEQQMVCMSDTQTSTTTSFVANTLYWYYSSCCRMKQCLLDLTRVTMQLEVGIE